jgi:hypothetical protein
MYLPMQLFAQVVSSPAVSLHWKQQKSYPSKKYIDIIIMCSYYINIEINTHNAINNRNIINIRDCVTRFFTSGFFIEKFPTVCEIFLLQVFLEVSNASLLKP